jgi:thiol-disulfide isomerase/thioredoxin
MKFNYRLFALLFALGFMLFATACADKGSEESSFANFTALDLDGNEVNQEIFSDYKITMINVWATFCGPCLDEMPALGKLAGEYAEKGVRVVGIVIDVLDGNGEPVESQLELAREIVEETGADYLHLLPSADLIEAKLKQVSLIPITFFVDSEGNQVDSFLGAKEKAEWANIIDSMLESVSE